MEISMLKEHLGDALYAQVEEKLSGIEGMQVIATKDGTWLPKGRLDEEIARRRELQEELEKSREKLRENEELRERIGQLTREAQEREQALTEAKIQGSLREALTQARAKDVSLAEKLLIGEVRRAEDAREAVNALRKKSPYLFEDAAEGLRAGFGGAGGSQRSGGGHADVNGAIRAAAGRY